MTSSLDDQRTKLLEYEERLVSFFVKSGKIKKIHSKFSTILGYFYTRRSLTQKQLRELTGFSAGTISHMLNQLLAIGMIRRHNIPGSRERRYELIGIRFDVSSRAATPDVIQELIGYIKGVESLLDAIDADLKRINQRVNALQQQGGSGVDDQLAKRAIPEKIQRMQAFIIDFAPTIPIFKRVLNFLVVEMRKNVS
ncbi:MAG: hypothetical protein ACFFCW_43055 [Candidatus Hodarchaeota archaeon]